jgi:Repeat of unknown function (DUF5648)
MKNAHVRHGFTRGWLALAIATAASTAAAATGQSGTVTLTPNVYESQMELKWILPDDFGPIGPCNASFQYSIMVDLDGAPVRGLTFNNQNSRLVRDASAGGRCVLKRTIVPGAVYFDQISPGVWRATGSLPGLASTVESRAINACTAIQGKQPMYWTQHIPYTDNLYTTNPSDRDISLGIGYINRGVPFYMPYRAEFDSVDFRRYFKGPPQLEHFYTRDPWEMQYVEQNGWQFEGDEGSIFTKAKPGTAALYRYAYYDAGTGDLQHFYSLSSTGPLGQPGWTSGGLVGYVCPP